MPNDNTRVEAITGRERRRRYTANEKLALVDSGYAPARHQTAYGGALARQAPLNGQR